VEEAGHFGENGDELPTFQEARTMLTLHDSGSRLCDGLTRREWLRIGSVGAFGLGLPGFLRARPSAAPDTPSNGFGKAKACIVLCFLGGPPQHETWDPKPDAPLEVRGDLKPIASATSGIFVGELMPRIARLTDRLCILRGVSTRDNAHSSSGYYMTTGHPHVPLGVENAKPGAPNDWPCPGALVRRLRPDGSLPSAITLPEQVANDGNLTWPGQDAGFLGRASDPWLLTCEPAAAQFQLPGLALAGDVPALRFDQRRSLLEQVNQHLGAIDRSGAVGVFDARSQQAFDLLRSPSARQAFDLDREPAAVRDRYGRTTFGQSALLARRFVEAGVSLIRVNWRRVPGALNNGHWDTHGKNTQALKQLMPIMDQGYSALIEDLAQRGLLDQTLVVWMAEFGRTPRLNGGGGRDHWGQVFSVALAGGGVRGGQVVGASDRIGGYPKDVRVRPEDLIATLFHAFGHGSETTYLDSLGRPHPLSRGEVIQQVF
jgi:hypothetical protein